MPDVTGSREGLALAVFERILETEKGNGSFEGPSDYVDLLADILLAIDSPAGRRG